MFANYKNENQKLLEELDEVKTDLARAKKDKRDAEFSKMLVTRSNMKLEEAVDFAGRELVRLQDLNDELITKVSELAQGKVKDNAAHEMAIKVRDREIEGQAKYTAELRSYTNSLHEKIRELNTKVSGYKEREQRFISDNCDLAAKVNELEEKLNDSVHHQVASQHLRIENKRLRERVIQLETSLDNIIDIAEEA
ncbi:hypothetical protein Q9R38_26210 [Priestia aryabhattai]|uniref:hypothetical protein n=1 Tax=Priestia aryabhattai TaxID=412384 RepID=UPI002881C0E2|nr:hypothetical protein [Priestia aryabhattai]MDT0150039.1 hypothetical protein [Priestia aryabhattai]MDT0155609.1 hypothetical protein [Priestia aryabhattai]